MAIQEIRVAEYTCEKCGWKWISRINGKDGTVPQRCARCKSRNWNRKGITPEEKGLRKRIHGFKGLYDYAGILLESRLGYDAKISWQNGLIEQFLNLSPQPTVSELRQVVYPEGLMLRPLNSQNQYDRIGYVPDPEEPELHTYNLQKFIELRRYEAQRRQEIMLQIINSRTK